MAHPPPTPGQSEVEVSALPDLDAFAWRSSKGGLVSSWSELRLAGVNHFGLGLDKSEPRRRKTGRARPRAVSVGEARQV